ncbi:acetyltransferases [Longilinea arvoryzae]|uniref:Acetyltransferases n=1 Tax=Longilinea arvoryzae TaxID=360412 RepID=A0A0S7BBX5_9CHLR|nr:GNAT family N-acetyltransferase [Longilinea arvoryzae]GAP15359.1 acetyltransferases [Longilinea arvoryzae]
MSTSITTHATHLRPVDVRKDLPEIADLIELCFASTMDADGREYIRQIRRMAMENRGIGLAIPAARRFVVPIQGYVWTESDHIVGNLTLIPYFKGSKVVYMIANVAVHPDYRRRGIARQLTQQGINHAREHGASATWLQVRDDNPGATQLYLSLGFIERARRTNWTFDSSGQPIPPLTPRVTIRRRTMNDWHFQFRWLQEIYPPEISWNLPFQINRLQPGFWREFMRWMNGERMNQWSAWLDDRFLGAAAWEPGNVVTDVIWLATNPLEEDLAAQALLTHARRILPPHRTVTINFPAGFAVKGLEAAGFKAHNTLIWMETSFSNPARNG